MSSCAVCGDKANGSRYGAPACLGCIVFFRRAVCKKAEYKCPKTMNCPITYESRCICRFCRFQKCLNVGMMPSAIQRRDIMGPRKKKVEEQPQTNGWTAGASGTPSPWDGVASPIPGPSTSSCTMIIQLERLQRRQRQNHLVASCSLDDTLAWGNEMFEHVNEILHRPPFRRARKRDVNFMLKTGLTDALEWANQFAPFRQLNVATKKKILTEYGLAYMMVDQGSVTATRRDDDYWMLQNNTYMSPDYLKGLPIEDHKLKDVDAKVKLHSVFVLDAIHGVGCPMRQMGIDAYECAVLKTILLLSHKNAFGHDHWDQLNRLQERIWKELLYYCNQKNPKNGAERAGSIILFTASIRCSIRSLHNQTLVSDIFNLMTFNPLVRDVYIESS